MPLYLYSNIYASGLVPEGWTPTKGATIKYPVRNPLFVVISAYYCPANGKRSSKMAIQVKYIILNTPPARLQA